MKTKFKNVIEILDYFNSEKKCNDLLVLQRWNGNVVCPHCAKEGIVSGNPYVTNRGFKCSEKTCYKKFTVTVGTVLENSKIPLRKWFAGIYIATAHKKGISSYQLSRDIGVTQKTAWFMLGRIREMMKQKSNPILSGVVECDETYIGGRESNKHASNRNSLPQSLNNKSTVVGALERGKRVIVKVVNGSKAKDILPVLLYNVKPSTVVMTDNSFVYKRIGNYYKEHHVINHSVKEYVRGYCHTNGIENFWSLLKRGIIGIYHQVSPKHLHRYCDEFTYRFNSRDVSDSERFINSLARITNGVLPYKEYIKKV